MVCRARHKTACCWTTNNRVPPSNGARFDAQFVTVLTIEIEECSDDKTTRFRQVGTANFSIQIIMVSCRFWYSNDQTELIPLWHRKRSKLQMESFGRKTARL